MSQSVARSASRNPVLLPDIGRPRMAKANVQVPDIDVNDPWMARIGGAIDRAIQRTGLSHKQIAGKANVDDALLGKWISGTRRPHFDRLFKIEELQQPLSIEIGKLAPMAFEVTRIEYGKRPA